MSEARARPVVAARSGGVCERCGAERAAEQHHRRKPGRVWCPANLGHLGWRCHRWVEAEPTAAKAEGWWVEPWEDPETVPVRRYAAWPGREVWLRPDGAVAWSGPGERD